MCVCVWGWGGWGSGEGGVEERVVFRGKRINEVMLVLL